MHCFHSDEYMSQRETWRDVSLYKWPRFLCRHVCMYMLTIVTCNFIFIFSFITLLDTRVLHPSIKKNGCIIGPLDTWMIFTRWTKLNINMIKSMKTNRQHGRTKDRVTCAILKIWSLKNASPQLLFVAWGLTLVERWQQNIRPWKWGQLLNLEGSPFRKATSQYKAMG